MRLIVSVIICSALVVTPAAAADNLDGYFIALETCEAFQSKNKKTNPGDIETNPFHAYEIIAINKKGGDFFQIKVRGAPVTTDRWVHVSCGVHVVEAGTVVASDPSTIPPIVAPEPGEESRNNLLALSWQPSFCETKPNKTECRELNDGNLPVTERALSIHGLWPQPRGNDYCGVPPALVSLDKAKKWADLPAVEMDQETREALEVAMPGTASFLERHEWIKHGTCFKGDGGSDEYYDDTLLVLNAINDSIIGEFLAAHVGAVVETRDIRDRFDTVFGAGAGERVQFHCTGDGRRTLIQELKVHLRGEIDPDTKLSELLLAADAVSIGCPRGTIDPAGLQ